MTTRGYFSYSYDLESFDVIAVILCGVVDSVKEMGCQLLKDDCAPWSQLLKVGLK
jgi:hypothetical protein